MTDLELIFTMLGEKVTTKISQKEKPKGMEENKKVARRGGGVAGMAREKTEKELGKSVVSGENFLSADSANNAVRSIGKSKKQRVVNKRRSE